MKKIIIMSARRQCRQPAQRLPLSWALRLCGSRLPLHFKRFSLMAAAQHTKWERSEWVCEYVWKHQFVLLKIFTRIDPKRMPSQLISCSHTLHISAFCCQISSFRFHAHIFAHSTPNMDSFRIPKYVCACRMTVVVASFVGGVGE